MTSQGLPNPTGVPRWNANIAALRTLRELEAQGKEATAAERRILEGYSGFGGSEFGQAFEPNTRDDAWKRRGDELRDLVTEDEYDAITGSRLNAFYTTPEVIKTMWEGLEALGANKAERLRILEPSAGTGRFLEYQPAAMARKSERTAVELDDLTARVLASKFPKDMVYHAGFESAPLPDDHYDIAISNVPFGNYGVHDPEHSDYITRSIHNYFFAKALDKVRPGGVVAFITTRFTMDASRAEPVREYLAERADLLGAVRLPSGTFPDTKVVTDIIYLRKRPEGEPQGDTSWVETEPVNLAFDTGYRTGSANVNRYYVENPEQVLGRQEIATHGMRNEAEYRVVADDMSSVPASAERALVRDLSEDGGETLARIPESRTTTLRVEPPKPQARLSKADSAKVDALESIHTKAEELLQMERTLGDDPRIEGARQALLAEYESYRKQHGVLNGKASREAIRELEARKGRPVALLLALETSEGNPTALLKGRQLRGDVRNVATPEDAMLVSQGSTGRLDFRHMASLLPGQAPESIRDALVESGSIYHDPASDNWVTAPEYLSGPVMDKLERARTAAASNPFYQRNVEALQAAQPERIPHTNIRVRLGSAWVPHDVINDFVADTFETGHHEYYRYDPNQAMWLMDRSEPRDRTGRFDAGKMDAADVLLTTLRNKPIAVTTKGRFDQEATELAKDRRDRLQEAFASWVWNDPERRQRLEDTYNARFNDSVPREFNERGRLAFDGLNAKWRNALRPHQRDAIFRTVHDGTVLLAHEVGFGKTAVIIASIMERKRLGLTDKAMIVLPKSISGQFADSFREMYPGANVLTPQGDDFKTENRERFLARVGAHDWDAVILTREQFDELPLKPETESWWLRKQIRETREALGLIREASGGEKKGHAQNALENRLKQWEKRLQDVQDKARKRSKDTVHFEDLGIDQLAVDEAHGYKNLPYVTTMGQVKGLPQTGSQRAWDMFMKVQHLQRMGERKAGAFARQGTVFATGTPVSNSIAETWTMMRYLQPRELERRGLEKFDAWAGTYGEVRDALEPTVSGGYAVTARFAKLQNVPELKSLFQNVADIRVAREVPGMAAVRPRVVTDDGAPGRTLVKAPLHPALDQYMQQIAQRAEAIKNKRVDPDEDNMLKLANDAAEAALDVRMQWNEAPYNPQGKIQLAADNVARIYKETTPEQGTQLISLDRGTPPTTKERKAKAKDGYVVDLYEQMRTELDRRGVPRDKVAFIHEATSEEKRDELFEKVNDGTIRVLMASTEKGGTGLNVQKRAAALHHIDVAWRPSDIEQREGRIIRQGNKGYGPTISEDGEILSEGKGVRIYTYVQEGSFDQFKWGTIEAKAVPISQIMTRKIDPTLREIEDADDVEITASMAKALATRDPVALQAAELEEDIRRLRTLKRALDSDAKLAKGRLREIEWLAQRNEGAVERMESDARDVESLPAPPDAKKFKLEIRGQEHDSRSEASQALTEEILRSSWNPNDKFRGREVADYRGFKVEAANDGQGNYFLTLIGPSGQDYQTEFVDRPNVTGKNWMQRLDNLIKDIPEKLDTRKERLERQQQEATSVRRRAAGEFEHEAELQALVEEYALAERELAQGTPEGRQQLAEMKLARTGKADKRLEGNTFTFAGASSPTVQAEPAPMALEPQAVGASESVPEIVEVPAPESQLRPWGGA